MSRLLRDAWFQMFAGISALCLIIMGTDWLAVHGATQTPLSIASQIVSSVAPETPPTPQPATTTPSPPLPKPSPSPLPTKEANSWLVALSPGPGIDATSLTQAVALAKNGDTIRMRPGHYRETIETGGKWLIIRGEGSRPDEVLLESFQPIALSVTKGSVVLENLSINRRRRDPKEPPFAGRSAGIFVSGAKLVLKNVVVSGWGAAIQAAQDQDPVILEAASSRLAGTSEDLLVRGNVRVDFKEVSFSHLFAPIVAWRGADLFLRACQFPAAAGLSLFVYENSRVQFVDMPQPPLVAWARAEAAARNDEASFLPAGSPAAETPPADKKEPMKIIRLNSPNKKWNNKDIFGKRTK